MIWLYTLQPRCPLARGGRKRRSLGRVSVEKTYGSESRDMAARWFLLGQGSTRRFPGRLQLNEQLRYSLWGVKTFRFCQQFSMCTTMLLYWDYYNSCVHSFCKYNIKHNALVDGIRSLLKNFAAEPHADTQTLTFHSSLLVRAICSRCTLTLLCHKTCPSVILIHAGGWTEKGATRWATLKKEPEKVNYRIKTFFSH